MFTSPANRHYHTIAAVGVAAIIATAGIAAAAATSSGDASSTDVTTPITTSVAVTAATQPADLDPTSPATTPTGDSAGGASSTTAAPAQSTTSASAAEPVADPADEIDEPEAPEDPGVVDGEDPGDPPTPPTPGPQELLGPVEKPDPPKPTVPGPTDLLPGNGGGDPDPTPYQVATDFQVAQLPSYLGTITSGLTGCQLECVTSALITANDFDPSVMLDVKTTVPVHVEVEITKTGTDSSKYFNGPGYDTEWSLHLSPLQPDTEYDLSLMVIDQEGHSRHFDHQFTTVDVIDGLVGNAQGCALHCITEGVVDKTDLFSKVQLHVETDVPAALDVWVSPSEPGSIGGTPILPDDAKVYGNDNDSTSWTFDVTGLEADTTYHVIARAEDHWGVDHQIGTFHTDHAPPVPVTVTFERIDVLYDGDSGALNRGELSFSWGFDGNAIGHRSEEKMHAGTTINLSSHNSQSFLLPAEGWSLPNLTVGGSERDWDGKAEFCSAGWGPGTAPHYNADCDSKTNVAQWSRPVTQADVEGLPTCATFGLGADKADRKCAVIGTPNEGGDYARFNVLISFDAP